MKPSPCKTGLVQSWGLGQSGRFYKPFRPFVCVHLKQFKKLLGIYLEGTLYTSLLPSQKPQATYTFQKPRTPTLESTHPHTNWPYLKNYMGLTALQFRWKFGSFGLEVKNLVLKISYLQDFPQCNLCHNFLFSFHRDETEKPTIELSIKSPP